MSDKEIMNAIEEKLSSQGTKTNHISSSAVVDLIPVAISIIVSIVKIIETITSKKE